MGKSIAYTSTKDNVVEWVCRHLNRAEASCNVLQLLKFIKDFFIDLKSNYWFIPAVMSLSAAILTVIMIKVDQALGQTFLKSFHILYSNQPEGARALLSTIAGSMITVAGVTFAMTLLSVSHAASQIGPRTVSGFMNDRGNQITLGTFIATFVYCILVLRTIHSGVESSDQFDKVSSFVPHLSILMAIVLALLSVSVLIYFIHHVPRMLSTTATVARIGSSLIDKMKTFFSESTDHAQTEHSEHIELSNHQFQQSKQAIGCDQSGFIRYVDGKNLLQVAKKHHIIIELILQPGDYLLPNVPLAYVSDIKGETLEKVTKEILANIFWDSQRSAQQDFFFDVDLLVEIAVRALSPGINDPHTAMECINQWTAGLIVISQRQIPSKYRMDEDHHLRLIMPSISKENYVDRFCDKIRQHMCQDAWTSLHMLEKLSTAYQVSSDQVLRQHIRTHAQFIKDAAMAQLHQPRDQDIVQRAFDRFPAAA